MRPGRTTCASSSFIHPRLGHLESVTPCECKTTESVYLCRLGRMTQPAPWQPCQTCSCRHVGDFASHNRHHAPLNSAQHAPQHRRHENDIRCQQDCSHASSSCISCCCRASLADTANKLNTTPWAVSMRQPTLPHAMARPASDAVGVGKAPRVVQMLHASVSPRTAQPAEQLIVWMARSCACSGHLLSWPSASSAHLWKWQPRHT